MTHMGTDAGRPSFVVPLPPPTDTRRTVAGNWWVSAKCDNVFNYGFHLPVRVFGAGNDTDTFSFAKGFFYPSFLSLEEKEVEIRQVYSPALIRVHSFTFIKVICL